MTISPFVIVTTDSQGRRDHLLQPLQDALAALPSRVVRDPGRDTPGTLRQRLTRAVLEQLDTLPGDTTHVVWLEDDVQPCDDFPAVLEAIVEAQPDAVLALWVCSGRFEHSRPPTPDQLERDGPTFVPLPSPLVPRNVATAFPTPLARAYRDWINNLTGYGLEDFLAWWINAAEVPFYAPVPSPVEHPDVEPSLARPNRRGEARTAYVFDATGRAWLEASAAELATA